MSEKQPQPVVNMREIAELTGVSIATVSRSLANKAGVSEKTREQVIAACEKLGYKTNPLVAALMRSRRRNKDPLPGLTLAFITAFPTADGWQKHPSPIFRQMFAGAKKRAEERNYNLEHFWLYHEGMSNKRFSQILSARGIRGLLFAPPPKDQLKIELMWDEFSVVVLGITPGTNRFNRVTTDYYQSMLLAMEHCAQLNYKRPGLAVRWETNSRLEFRWEAAHNIAVKHLGLELLKPLLASEWTTENVTSWLKEQKPDVVIGPVLGSLIKLVESSDAKIADEVGLVGLLVPCAGDRLSGVLQNGELMGATAVDQLISQLERNETGIPENPITHTMLGRWNQGQTVRKHRDLSIQIPFPTV